MKSNIDERRGLALELLETRRSKTRSALSGLDPEQVVHDDERAWRVRDVLGHLAVWNGEAARSLEAYAGGGEYTCIPSEAKYYEYNGPAADERRRWTMEQVWAEYEVTHDRLRSVIERMPDEKWDEVMRFPWNERGTVEQLIQIMMKHEAVDHCALIMKAMAA